MGLFAPKEKPLSFKAAVRKAAAALEEMEAKAVTAEEWKSVADTWLALVSELNPAGLDKPGKKDKDDD